MSIHDSGQKAAEAFEKIPWPHEFKLKFGPKAGPTAKGVPDCSITVSGDFTIPVEIKKASTGVSQIRAISYEVLVIWDHPHWYVLPPNEVMKLVADKAGQHCLNPFECCNPGKPTGSWIQWRKNADEVPQEIILAHIEGGKSPMKKIAIEMSCEISDYVSQKIDLVRGV